MVEAYVQKHLRLLEDERTCEIEENRQLHENVSPKELQSRGLCLLKLRIESRKTGLYGRTVLVFEPQWQGKELPSHRFTPGDIAGLSVSTSNEAGGDMLASGIVSRAVANTVSVAFDESHDLYTIDDDALYKLVKLANEVTYRRLKKTLNDLNSYRGGPASQLISVLFEETEVSIPYTSQPELQLYNENLDNSQKEAVEFALSQREVAVVHGPPGTGKTTTVVEIIRQAVKQGLKVLACAPSNIAVDNLVERVTNGGVNAVRLGHPARVLPSIQRYALDALLSHSDETSIVQDVRKDIDKTMSKIRKSRNKGEKHQLRSEMKALRKELREREAAATEAILKRAQVVLATLTGASDDGPLKHLPHDHFDLVVIDECSQAVEAACWVALLRGPRCVLAGDHLQLPPTIISHKAAKAGLAVTLMERVLKAHGDKVMRMLTTQYRMNELIMRWPSEKLYQGKLVAHQSVATHLLRDLEGLEDTEDTSIALLLIDTAGCDMQELDTPDDVSKGNEGEADIVAVHVERLIAAGLSADQIAVIAPYNLQVELLRLRLSQKYAKLEIKSVDGFQGREKEAVILTLVRSNVKGDVGFLSEDRRINVAITRARRHLAVVCDTQTVSKHEFLKSMVDYLSNNGEVRSAHEYQDEGLLQTTYKRPDLLDDQLNRAAAATKAKAKTNKPQSAQQKDQKKPQNKPVIHKDIRVKHHEKKPFKHETWKMPEKDEDSDEAELEALITDFFIDERRQAHYFPVTLTPKQRFFVHEVAQRIGLKHESTGEGSDRHITIKKLFVKPQSSSSASTQQETPKETRSSNFKVLSENTGIKQSSEKMTLDTLEKHATEGNCAKCGKSVPKANLELHELRCSGLPSSAGSTSAITDGTKPKTKKKSKTGAAKQTKDNAAGEEEDFDTLIANAMKENSSCAFKSIKKCKALTTMLGQNCEHCAKRYCLAHHIPEVHGCGDAAKGRARMLISKEGKIYRGSGVPSHLPDPDKRAHLQKRLDKKKEELNERRQKKNK